MAVGSRLYRMTCTVSAAVLSALSSPSDLSLNSSLLSGPRLRSSRRDSSSSPKRGEIVRLDAAFMALTMDVICDYAFAKDRCYLDKPDFELCWKQTIIGAFEGGTLGRQFPWILPFIKKLSHSFVAAMNPVVGNLLY